MTWGKANLALLAEWRSAEANKKRSQYSSPSTTRQLSQHPLIHHRAPGLHPPQPPPGVMGVTWVQGPQAVQMPLAGPNGRTRVWGECGWGEGVCSPGTHSPAARLAGNRPWPATTSGPDLPPMIPDPLGCEGLPEALRGRGVERRLSPHTGGCAHIYLEVHNTL